MKIVLFSDSCIGQNKNSVVIASFINFLETSRSTVEIVINYFEPGHGQNSGDSIHATCEREIRETSQVEGAVHVPSHIVPCLARACKHRPYEVVQIDQKDVLDWKSYAEKIGIRKARQNIEDEGELDWKRMKSMKLLKNECALYYKNSHASTAYHKVMLPRTTRQTKSKIPPRVYTEPNPISKRKHDDLMFLCKSVVINDENRSFYEHLSYSS